MFDHPDIPIEQAHIDRAYESLVAMREQALRMRKMTVGQVGGTAQERVERNYFDEKLVQMLNDIDIGDGALVFGRIDQAAEAGGEPEAFHIGRLAVHDGDNNQLVVDWRAPIAEAFYRATGREPMGLGRRRHFMVDGRTLTAIEDELFGQGHLGIGPDDGLSDGLSNAPQLGGQSTLLATLRKGRSGQLGDIVATIQAEQDVIIRAPNKGVLVVQGGPGTGKTVVALHRAAYLLYTHRFPLADQGVLVVGPNRVFLRYIERVLPSLGESGVREVVLADLVPGVRFGAIDSPLAKRVKGDLRMVEVLERAIAQRQRSITETFEMPYGGSVLRLQPKSVSRVVREARKRAPRHNELCRTVEGEIVAMLLANESKKEDFSLGEARAKLREFSDFRRLMFAIWPSLAPDELLHDFFGSKALLRKAGEGILTDEEIESLYRPRAESLSAAVFSDADVALLDTARHLLGPKPRKGGVVDEDDEPEQYGHIIVDEVQDLTPMQLQMVSRRSLNGAMTVVGDIAQATGPFAPGDWRDVLDLLPKNRDARVAELSVGYRIPRQIMEFAGRLLATAAPGQTPPTAVREGESEPRIVATTSERVAATVASEAAELTKSIADGRVAVVCPDDMVDDVAAALTAAGLAFGRAGEKALEAQLTIVPVSVVKGLEMDGVIVVEPTAMYESPDVGPRGVYVALTRSTQRLTVVHSRELPRELRD